MEEVKKIRLKQEGGAYTTYGIQDARAREDIATLKERVDELDGNVTVNVNPASGTFYRYGEPCTDNWCEKFVAGGNVAVRVETTDAARKFNLREQPSDGIYISSGQMQGWRIVAPDGYRIKGYRLSAVLRTEGQATITASTGQEIVVTQEHGASLVVTGLNAQETTFMTTDSSTIWGDRQIWILSFEISAERTDRFAMKGEVDAALKTAKDYADGLDAVTNSRIDALGSVYKAKGSSAWTVADATSPLMLSTPGDAWNITESFTLGGKTYPAGTNVVCVASSMSTPDYNNRFDALAGEIDLSGFYTKTEVDAKLPTDVSRSQTDATFVSRNNQALFYLRSATSSLAGLMTAGDKVKMDANTLEGKGITDAYTKNEINSSVVKYDGQQSLTSTQKTQARANIGAAALNGDSDEDFFAHDLQVDHDGEIDNSLSVGVDVTVGRNVTLGGSLSLNGTTISEGLDEVLIHDSETNKTISIPTDISGQVALADDVASAMRYADELNRQKQAQIDALKSIINGLKGAEGYIRVAGSSDPALGYKSYKYNETAGFASDSVFRMLYPCLVGTKLTGDNAQVGKILHVLKKLGARIATAADTAFTEGQAVWDDVDGTPHAIDGSEGDVMITNIAVYYRLKGKFTVQGTEYDVYLVAPTPFTWQGYEAELVTKRGVSPDYCVSHADTDSVTRMHSVYNPAWNGTYQAPAGVVGKFIYSQDAQTGEITEQYDETATLLGGAGGCSSTNLALYTGEQHAMNHNPDTTKMLPFANQTAASVEDWYALLLAEGGTFDAHKAALMGSGFSSNDPATSAADWEESAAGAKNGIRIYDKEGTPRYYSPAANAETSIGLTGSAGKMFGTIVNSYNTPFKVMEAHRAVSYAVSRGIGEMQWFVFEGNKYKYRSVSGFAGPQQGEMTCVVWKMLSTKLGSTCFDPTDKTTSIEGHRIDLLFSTALFHGITTQVSPSWWVSGLVFTEDEQQNYEAYLQTDPSKLALTPNGEKDMADIWPFEQDYEHVASYAYGSGYRKNYARQSLFLAPDNANKSGAGLHTYIDAYNYYTGTAAAAGKKAVRGFQRGGSVIITYLSPLYVFAYNAPSYASAYIAFGNCVRIVD